MNERVVEADGGRPPGQHQEERAVGGGGVQPEAVDRRDVGSRAEGARTVVVRVDVAAHQLALGGVGEHVAAEERGHHHERHQPEGQHVGQLLDGHAGPGAQRSIQTEPDPDEEDHSPVDGDDAGKEEPGRARAGRAEEPGAAHLELEGRARERGADADGQDGDEAEDGRLAQPGPVAGVDRLGLDALGQGPGRAHAHAQRLAPDGEAAQARRGPVQDGGRGRGRGIRRAVVHVHGGVSLVVWLVSAATQGTGRRPGRATPRDRCRPQSIRNSIVTGVPWGARINRWPTVQRAGPPDRCVGREGFEPP